MFEDGSSHERAAPVAKIEEAQADAAVLATAAAETTRQSMAAQDETAASESTSAIPPQSQESGDVVTEPKESNEEGSLRAPLPNSSNSSKDVREASEQSTLWMGDLPYWADEGFLFSLFAHTREVVSTKVIRNKATGISEGYGFVEFASHATADFMLRTCNGAQIPNTDHYFRLNWASFSNGQRRGEDHATEHSIFVGDLAADVSDYVLQETFRVKYPSVRSAKCVTDPASGRSKGYGFVRFGSEDEMKRAMTEMNGQVLSNRPMRINPATPKKPSPSSSAYHIGTGAAGGMSPSLAHSGLSLSPNAVGGAVAMVPPHQRHPYHARTAAVKPVALPQAATDANNTTLFVGGLDPQISEQELEGSFSPYGDIVYVKIPPGRGCGFVQFQERAHAEAALAKMQKQKLGSHFIRLSWGRAPKHPSANAHLHSHSRYPAIAGSYPQYPSPPPPPHHHNHSPPPPPPRHHPHSFNSTHHNARFQSHQHHLVVSPNSFGSVASPGTGSVAAAAVAAAGGSAMPGGGYQIPNVYPMQYAVYSGQYGSPTYPYAWQHQYYTGPSSQAVNPGFLTGEQVNPGLAAKMTAPTTVSDTSLPTNIDSLRPGNGSAAVAPLAATNNGANSGSRGQENHSYVMQSSPQLGGNLDVVEASQIIRKLAGITVSNDSLPIHKSLPAEADAAISTVQIHAPSSNVTDLKDETPSIFLQQPVSQPVHDMSAGSHGQHGHHQKVLGAPASDSRDPGTLTSTITQ